jgi:arginase
MDLGADRRGVDMGPSALRIAGIERKLRNMGYEVSDLGDIHIQTKETQDITNSRLKYLDEIVRASEILAEKVERTLSKWRFPLCIGGDHSISIGSIAGIASYCSKNDSILILLDWLRSNRCPCQKLLTQCHPHTPHRLHPSIPEVQPRYSSSFYQ